MEKFKRRKNLLFFGVAENEKSYHDLEKTVLDIINNVIKIKCERNCIEYVRRLGIKADKVRPIDVTMLTMGLKIKIQKNKKKLETTSYYIKEDFPLEILNKRKALQSKAEEERKNGRKAFIKYDRLIIINNDHQKTAPQETYNKKRNLSESPEATTSSSKNTKQNKNQPLKINKINKMDNFITKTPTLTYPESNRSQTYSPSGSRNTE